jgi:hypothetical protein
VTRQDQAPPLLPTSVPQRRIPSISSALSQYSFNATTTQESCLQALIQLRNRVSKDEFCHCLFI